MAGRVGVCVLSFSYHGKRVELKGLAAAQLIEEGSLTQCNKFEKKGLML